MKKNSKKHDYGIEMNDSKPKKKSKKMGYGMDVKDGYGKSDYDFQKDFKKLTGKKIGI